LPEHIPSPTKWVADQVELYERTNGAKGTTLRETGLPVIIVTNIGRRTGAVRKTPLMLVKDGDNYLLVASKGGAPEHPVWYYNLLAEPDVEITDGAVVQRMRVRAVKDPAERSRLWKIAVQAYQPYEECQKRTERLIPVFVAEPRA
jgi:deazaflavin-dependent oxidoreductase (nitroreductase family)